MTEVEVEAMVTMMVVVAEECHVVDDILVVVCARASYDGEVCR